MCDFNSINIEIFKMKIHDNLISRLRKRRSTPLIRTNSIANTIRTNSSASSSSSTSTISTKKSKNINGENLNSGIYSDESSDTLNGSNDNLETLFDNINIEDNENKFNKRNAYRSVPDFSTLKEEDLLNLKNIKNESISSPDIYSKRRSFIIKVGERISSVIGRFESRIKNFDAGICQDLSIDMNTMVKVLEEESLAGIAKYIKDHDCKNIIVMSGAGISTNAEIPDFRSADRGVYANVEKYNIPYPEAIFDLEYFKTNPKPFTMFAKEIYPQNIRPTIAHCFIKLLDNHNILLRHYTQNIDGLDYQTKLDSDRIIESHGSFHQSYCVGTSEKESCGTVYSQAWYNERLFKGENPILCTKCQGYVKPGVIFFKESLPPKFFKSLHEDIPKCDLLLILGTSLKVYPFASIIKSVSKKIPRCLINNTLPEIFESELLCDSSSTEYIFSGNQYKRDVIYMGDCDKGCIELAQALGWEDELMEIYNNEIENANKYFN